MNDDRRAVMELYLSSFSARRDAYVRNSRAHMDEPLTWDLADQALREGFSLSGYMATRRDDSFVTHVGAIDFDMDDGFDIATKIRSYLGTQGIDSLLVKSRRGAHLWVPCTGAGVLPASIVRRALTNALTANDIMSDKAEVFPKRSKKDWGVGALRLPLMRHPKSGVTYPVYEPFDGLEVNDPQHLVQVMADMQAPSAALYGLAGPDPVPESYPRWEHVLGRPIPIREDVPRVTSLLAGLGIQAEPGHSIRCPFHDDKKASLQVAVDDERAWCKAPACDLYNDGLGLGSWELEQHIGKDTRGAAQP